MLRPRDEGTPLGSGGDPGLVWLPSGLVGDVIETASICLLVCWSMEREYVLRSAGGEGENGIVSVSRDDDIG